MRNLTCIVCPIGCSLDVDVNSVDESGISNGGQESLSVTGNKCPRGAAYAREEIFAPKRVVTATCRIEGEAGSAKRAPVKTALPFPREKIPALLDEIYKIKVTLPVKAGDILLSNWSGEGIDVVATRSMG